MVRHNMSLDFVNTPSSLNDLSRVLTGVLTGGQSGCELSLTQFSYGAQVPWVANAYREFTWPGQFPLFQTKSLQNLHVTSGPTWSFGDTTNSTVSLAASAELHLPSWMEFSISNGTMDAHVDMFWNDLQLLESFTVTNNVKLDIQGPTAVNNTLVYGFSMSLGPLHLRPSVVKPVMESLINGVSSVFNLHLVPILNFDTMAGRIQLATAIEIVDTLDVPPQPLVKSVTMDSGVTQFSKLNQTHAELTSSMTFFLDPTILGVDEPITLKSMQCVGAILAPSSNSANSTSIATLGNQTFIPSSGTLNTGYKVNFVSIVDEIKECRTIKVPMGRVKVRTSKKILCID